jgi:hypothetical protein
MFQVEFSFGGRLNAEVGLRVFESVESVESV